MHASAPTWQLRLSTETATVASVLIENVPPAVRFTPAPDDLERVGATFVQARWKLSPGETIVEVDSGAEGPVRFGVISDLHVNLKVLEACAADSIPRGLEFIASMGDLVNRGQAGELDELLGALPALGVPFYPTIGNHDLYGGAADRFDERLGPTNLCFLHRGVHFAMVDSGSASVSPAACDWLEGQLSARPPGAPALVFTHIPPFDPSGFRNHAFRSREGAQRFLEVLHQRSVAQLFVGHIHTYAQYELNGVPVTLSGGGGGLVERLGSAGFHYLEVTVDPTAAEPVSIVRRDLA